LKAWKSWPVQKRKPWSGKIDLQVTASGRQGRRQGIRLHRLFPVLLALLALGLLTAGLMANVNREEGSRLVQRLPAAQPIPQQASPVALPNLLKPLTPDEAVKENEERPFDAAPDSPAAKFHINADEASRARALECLAQAVYYEAATENVDGQRAVAQVVLNRMRHPGFPSTVCGVVYQGSDLPTGCQFTFTCNGSLARTPVASLWNEAKKIATEALNGHVFAPIGHATHYHADYVLPYWADSLAKQVQIGHHIFYRLNGALGTSAAFSQRYAGSEPVPPQPSTVAVAAAVTDQTQALIKSGLAGTPALAADAAGLASQPAPKELLVADNNKGHLLIDQDRPQLPAKKRSNDNDCTASASKQILPASPDDLHAGNPTTC
jgi:spore germination cell wall hydrolase CwlJ-like protein